MTDLTTTRRGGIRVLAALIAIAAVAALTLAPRWIVAPARGAFMRLMDAATEPLLLWIPYGEAERVLNTIMFVPLGVTIALLLTRRAWPLAILAGFALSAAVEYAQASIPGRVPDPEDIVWNTVGAAVGVALVTLPRLLSAAVRAQRAKTTRT